MNCWGHAPQEFSIDRAPCRAPATRVPTTVSGSARSAVQGPCRTPLLRHSKTASLLLGTSLANRRLSAIESHVRPALQRLQRDSPVAVEVAAAAVTLNGPETTDNWMPQARLPWGRFSRTPLAGAALRRRVYLKTEADLGRNRAEDRGYRVLAAHWQCRPWAWKRSNSQSSAAPLRARWMNYKRR